MAGLADRAETAPVALLLQILFALSFVFMAVPGIDLAVAGWFAGAEGGFPLQASPALNLVRQLNQGLTLALLALAALSLLGAAADWPTRWLIRPYKALFLLAVYAVGPGIVVNLVLKNLFGRARPREITEFGGSLAFSGPWQFPGGCDGNCSFTSGEAASAAALLAVGLIVARSWRPLVLAALALPAAAFSLNRIAFGGHFLSDVVLSWLIVAIAMLLIWPFFATAAASIDRSVAGTGATARQFVIARLGLGRRPASP
jgi:membrane-associated phospholipid phosphatase